MLQGVRVRATFAKDDGVLWERELRLRGVFLIVQTDTEDLTCDKWGE